MMTEEGFEIDDDVIEYLAERQYLRGPEFVEWLVEVRPEIATDREAQLGHALTRRMYDWEEGGDVSFDLADKLLLKLGLYIDTDVPDHLWRTGKRTQRSPRHSLEKKQKAVELVASGMSTRAVAEAVGVSRSTIQNWRKAAAERGILSGHA